jgi:outer membrane protein
MCNNKKLWFVTLRFASGCGIGLWAALAQAHGAGDIITQIGILHAQTLDKGQELQTDLAATPGLKLAGIPTTFSSPGTGASLDNANTVQLAVSYFLTDHISVKTEGGIPPIFHITGFGKVQPASQYPLINNLGQSLGLLPSVDLGTPSSNPIAAARQWSPAVIGQYFFLSPDSRFRPNLGLGLTYTWFTDISVNSTLQDQLNRNFGTVLELARLQNLSDILRNGIPPTHVKASASYQWAPIYNAGFSYAITEHWGIIGSISYVALHATAHISIFAADGTQLSDTHGQMKLDPLASALLISYRF